MHPNRRWSKRHESVGSADSPKTIARKDHRRDLRRQSEMSRFALRLRFTMTTKPHRVAGKTCPTGIHDHPSIATVRGVQTPLRGRTRSGPPVLRSRSAVGFHGAGLRSPWPGTGSAFRPSASSVRLQSGPSPWLLPAIALWAVRRVIPCILLRGVRSVRKASVVATAKPSLPHPCRGWCRATARQGHERRSARGKICRQHPGRPTVCCDSVAADGVRVIDQSHTFRKSV